MNIEKMREEFEAWAKTQDWIVDLLYRDGYIGWEAQFAFDAWRSSRAAIEIELPETFQQYKGDNNQSMTASDVRKAIEAAGLKVKS
jgi:hypothetical protein